MGDRLATIDMGRKVGAAVSLPVGGAGSPLTQCRLGRRLPLYIASGILIHPAVWLLYTDVADSYDRQTTLR